MPGFLVEKVMLEKLGKYVPEGETIAAAIECTALQTRICCYYDKCEIDEENDMLVPSWDSLIGAIEIRKSKRAEYSAYIGITKNTLILCEMMNEMHYYEVNEAPASKAAFVQHLEKPTKHSDLGKCFPLAEIENCELKTSFTGAVKCVINMKNGSLLKLKLPKRSSAKRDMPHHEEYRENILSKLSAFSQER